MRQSRWLGILGLGVSIACVACGSSVAGGGGGQGGSGGNQQGSGAQQGTTSALDCAPLIADDQGTSVDVRVKNDTTADIFVQYSTNPFACTGSAPYQVLTPDGEVLNLSSGPCASTCQLGYGTTCTVTYTCAPVSVTRIAPQGTLTVPWGALSLELRSVPASCIPGNNSAGFSTTSDCYAWTKPQAFPLTFKSTVNTASTCNDPSCLCAPDASGTCEMESTYQLAGQTLTATASYAEGATMLDIVFQ